MIEGLAREPPDAPIRTELLIWLEFHPRQGPPSY